MCFEHPESMMNRTISTSCKKTLEDNGVLDTEEAPSNLSGSDSYVGAEDVQQSAFPLLYGRLLRSGGGYECFEWMVWRMKADLDSLSTPCLNRSDELQASHSFDLFKSRPQSQENVPQVAETVTTSNELDLLFSLMFDELLNGTTQVVSKSSVVTATDVPNKRQQQHTTPSTSTTVAADTPPLNIQTTPETTSQAPT
ncbi:hypothetical protein Tco_0556912 [Tanacetum coccineum]